MKVELNDFHEVCKFSMRFYSISDIRRENLAEIIQRCCDGRQTRLAENMCVQASVVSRWIKGRRAVGNSSARRIEQAAGKPKYWLDMKHDHYGDASNDIDSGRGYGEVHADLR